MFFFRKKIFSYVIEFNLWQYKMVVENISVEMIEETDFEKVSYWMQVNDSFTWNKWHPVNVHFFY